MKNRIIPKYLCMFLLLLILGCDKTTKSDTAMVNPENKGIDCRCSNPEGALGDYVCIAGKKYRCRNNVHDICEWQSTDDVCTETDSDQNTFAVTAEMLTMGDPKMMAANGTTSLRATADPMPKTSLGAEACAGQWTKYYCYKSGNLYILNLNTTNDCLDAYNRFKRCLGSFDNDTVYCNAVLACAPYTICN